MGTPSLSRAVVVCHRPLGQGAVRGSLGSLEAVTSLFGVFFEHPTSF